MAVLLVRHAHAGDPQQWSGDDALRPLSERGRRQARRLVDLLRPWSPRRVISSPSTRCVETVAPLAASLGLSAEPSDDLAVGAGSRAVALLRALVEDEVVLCTHGDVIAEVLVALADEDGLDLGWNPRQAKGSTWVLEADGGVYVKATYLPPEAEPRIGGDRRPG